MQTNDHGGSLTALAMLLGDSRLPTGSHAHSAGVEQAVMDYVIFDPKSLELFLAGRLGSGIAMEAYAAAMACHLAMTNQPTVEILKLESEIDARMAAPTARLASRRQGSQYLRATAHIFGPDGLNSSQRNESKDTASYNKAEPGRATEIADLKLLDNCDAPGPHLCIAVGITAATARLTPHDAALLLAYSAIAASASAALRLLGLDPYAVQSIVARLCADCDNLAHLASQSATGPAQGLLATATPLIDLLHETHSKRKEHLFAS